MLDEVADHDWNNGVEILQMVMYVMLEGSDTQYCVVTASTDTRPPVPPPIVTDQDIRNAVHLLTELVTTQRAQRMRGGAEKAEEPESSRIHEFLALNPAELRYITVLWYKGWERFRGRNSPPVRWTDFSGAFLDNFLPLEMQESRVDQFLALHQGDMTVLEYSLKFDSLARYAPSYVGTVRARIHRFIARLEPEYAGACTIDTIQDNMDPSRIHPLAQNLEELH
ncbi:hypothetical protein MTR67_051625 [Solanum verrucosum]|uniref:Retrotransposon gag domain-containing protein n=1 Tax=Solanum verrucosum TaxID=315347 RepID=A0AAF0V492_SOLVR|nr:hypothetical protein MTR67_051625 [Solanum verrucosum]